jgi:hypothetical protein
MSSLAEINAVLDKVRGAKITGLRTDNVLSDECMCGEGACSTRRIPDSGVFFVIDVELPDGTSTSFGVIGNPPLYKGQPPYFIRTDDEIKDIREQHESCYGTGHMKLD